MNLCEFRASQDVLLFYNMALECFYYFICVFFTDDDIVEHGVDLDYA